MSSRKRKAPEAESSHSSDKQKLFDEWLAHARLIPTVFSDDEIDGLLDAARNKDFSVFKALTEDQVSDMCMTHLLGCVVLLLGSAIDQCTLVAALARRPSMDETKVAFAVQMSAMTSIVQLHADLSDLPKLHAKLDGWFETFVLLDFLASHTFANLATIDASCPDIFRWVMSDLPEIDGAFDFVTSQLLPMMLGMVLNSEPVWRAVGMSTQDFIDLVMLTRPSAVHMEMLHDLADRQRTFEGARLGHGPDDEMSDDEDSDDDEPGQLWTGSAGTAEFLASLGVAFLDEALQQMSTEELAACEAGKAQFAQAKWPADKWEAVFDHTAVPKVLWTCIVDFLKL